MPRKKLIHLFARSYKAARKPSSSHLSQILESELKYELSTLPHYLSQEKLGSLGNFTLEWDDPKSQDVVLRRKHDLGEEIAVSALLGSPVYEAQEGLFPRPALMKVCVRKPGLSSILQLDCGITGRSEGGSEFTINNAYYLPSPSCFGDSVYKGPLFSVLAPQFQDALKEYLISRGIGEELTDFLLFHLHKRENTQYMNWLEKLKSFMRG